MPFCRDGNLSLYYEDAGSGVPVVCIHPPCLPSYIFTLLKAGLAGSRRAVLPELRGHGLSQAGDAALTLPLLAEDLRRMLECCGIKQAYLCAYGPASLLAQCAVLTYLDYFKGLILVSGMAAITNVISRSVLQGDFILSILQKPEEIVRRAVLRECGSSGQPVVHGLLEKAGKGEARCWREYASACIEGDYRSRLSRIKLPVLLIYGSEDKIGQSDAQEMTGLFPGAMTVEVHQGSRQLLLEDAPRVAAAIDEWLNHLDAAEPAGGRPGREQAMLQSLQALDMTAGAAPPRL